MKSSAAIIENQNQALAYSKKKKKKKIPASRKDKVKFVSKSFLIKFL